MLYFASKARSHPSHRRASRRPPLRALVFPERFELRQPFPFYPFFPDGRRIVAFQSAGAEKSAATEPTVVLNWVNGIRQMVAAAQADSAQSIAPPPLHPLRIKKIRRPSCIFLNSCYFGLRRLEVVNITNQSSYLASIGLQDFRAFCAPAPSVETPKALGAAKISTNRELRSAKYSFLIAMRRTEINAQLTENAREILEVAASPARATNSDLAFCVPNQSEMPASVSQSLKNTPKPPFLIAVWKIRTTLQPIENIHRRPLLIAERGRGCTPMEGSKKDAVHQKKSEFATLFSGRGWGQ